MFEIGCYKALVFRVEGLGFIGVIRVLYICRDKKVASRATGSHWSWGCPSASAPWWS